ncbi:hypothetical protein O3P69_008778 [Scylla paramamosain]|uniref:Obg domain-containing protein n=1 Tax=Scylla paramamosain TaxID=85552 RepID=A0AAW0SE25_SCYPA
MRWCEHWDKMKRVRSKFVDVLRLHVRGGAGGMGLPRLGGVGGAGGDVYVEGKEDHFSPCSPSHRPLLTLLSLTQTTSHPALPLTDHFSPCSPSHRPLLTLLSLSQTTSHPALPLTDHFSPCSPSLTDHFSPCSPSHRPFLTLLSLSQTTSHPALPLIDHFSPCSPSHRPLLTLPSLTDHFSPCSPSHRPLLTLLSISQTTSLLPCSLCLSLSLTGHSLLKLCKAQPDQQWVGAAGMDSYKYRICGEAGAELIIPVPTDHHRLARAAPEIAGNPSNQYNGQKGQPTLGVVKYSDMRRLTIADLQGLIEGAYSNMGMGHRFLCHVDINSFRLSPKHPYCSPTENVMLVNKDYVLCCSCGAKLTENSWDNFVNISIPLSEASQLVTILGHPHLMVQTLRNPADLAFDLVTVRSGLLRSGRGYLNQKPKPAQLTSKLPWRVSMDSF